VAVICFEWLQRPEKRRRRYPDVGRITARRNGRTPSASNINKTGALVWQPAGKRWSMARWCSSTARAEKIISHLPKLGIPMIMRKIGNGEKEGPSQEVVLPRHGEGCADHAQAD